MSTASIDPTAEIAEGVDIGHYAVIEAGARIGRGVRIGHQAVIRAGTVVGDGAAIDDLSILGKTPTVARTSTLKVGELEPLVLGSGVRVGAQAVIYAGTRIEGESLVADGAQVREHCWLGRGVIIGRNATIENHCRIGESTKLQTGAYITAESELEDHVFIAPMVTTTNDNYVGRTEKRFAARKGVTVRRYGRVGASAVILPGVTIGIEALVAAGSVVTRDVPDYVIVMGVPARVVREVPEEQLILDRGDRTC